MVSDAAGTPTTRPPDWRHLLGDSPELHDIFFTGTVTDSILIVLNKHQKLCIPETSICMCGTRLDSSHDYRCHVREELTKALVESGVLHIEYRLVSKDGGSVLGSGKADAPYDSVPRGWQQEAQLRGEWTKMP